MIITILIIQLRSRIAQPIVYLKNKKMSKNNNLSKAKKIKIFVYSIKSLLKSYALKIYKEYVRNALYSDNTKAINLKVYNKFNKKPITFIASLSMFIVKKQYFICFNLVNNKSSIKEGNKIRPSYNTEWK